MSIEFLLTSLVVVITPGVGVIYTMAAGLSRGAKASVVAAAGCTLGIIPHLIAAISGLAALLHTSAVAFQTIRYLGVAYLLYMAWSVLREKGALAVDDSSAPRGTLRVIGSAVVANLLNPKLTIFFFAFLPQFVPASTPNALGSMIELSAVFMLLTFVIFVGYGLFAVALRRHVISKPTVLGWLRRSFAAGFAALGARLAFSEG